MTVVIDTNPATGKAVAELNETDLATLPGRFEKARQAQRIWAAKSFRERAVHIKRMRNYIRDNAEELARVVSESTHRSHIAAAHRSDSGQARPGL